MKNLKVKTYSLLVNAETQATTCNLITYCLDQPPQGGFTRKDFIERDRIEKAVKESEDEIILEDADYANLVKIVNSTSWRVRHPEIGDFLSGFEK